MPMHTGGGNQSIDSRLFLALAEELKLPLLQVAHQTELYEQEYGVKLADLHTSARHALLLIDNYVLARQLSQTHLQLEPVAVSSVMYDVAQILQPLARQYACTVRVSLGGRFRPVMGHRLAMQGMLTALSTAIITASQKPNSIITLSARKSRGSIQTGVFGEIAGLGEPMLTQGKRLLGRARQPLSTLTAQPGVGVFIAQELGHVMGTDIRVAHHNNTKGLAALLAPSQQLVLL